MKENEFYSPSTFARNVGVHPSRITYLRRFLVKQEYDDNKKFLICNCEKNRALFVNKSPLRGRVKNA